MVYADHSRPGAGLDTPLLPALEGDVAALETYGEGKVACEDACWAARGDDVLVARSGLIAVRRPQRLVPGTGRAATRSLRRMAARCWSRSGPTGRRSSSTSEDLAAWLVEAGLRGVTGAVDAYGPQRMLGDVLAAARDVAGFTGTEVPVSDEAPQAAAGVEEFMGERSLALWLADPWAGFSAR